MNKEDYEVRLESLFQKWQKETGLSIKDKTFSPDGIVNPDMWFSETNKTRIMFVLKETNRWCNLCEYVVRKKADGKRVKWQTWYNVTRWTYLLRHIHDQTFDEMWQRIRSIDEGKRIYNLERVALVNVKKRPGGESTDKDELITAFERENRPFLLQEIALFGRLDYIVCCGKGVAHCLSQCYGGLKWKHHHQIARTPDDTLVIDFTHPQSREKKKDLFRKLYDVVMLNPRITSKFVETQSLNSSSLV